jgi:hypothetical protein
MAAPRLKYAESIVIARPPPVLYNMVSDVARMGEWSPVCVACWWDEGAGPAVGAWFTGRNVDSGETWETRSVVVAADPGREFAFQCGGDKARWGYTFTLVDGGTRVTEAWEFRPAGIAFFEERFGAGAPAEIAERSRDAHAGIPVTLAALKQVAESG